MDSDQDSGSWDKAFSLFSALQGFGLTGRVKGFQVEGFALDKLPGCQAESPEQWHSGPRALGLPSKVPNAGTSHRERLVKERFIRLSDDSMAQDWSSEMFESNRRRFLVDAKGVVLAEMSLSDIFRALDLNVSLPMEEETGLPGSELFLRAIIGSLMIMLPSSTSSSCRSHSSCSSSALIPGDNNFSVKHSRGSTKELCRFGGLIDLSTRTLLGSVPLQGLETPIISRNNERDRSPQASFDLVVTRILVFSPCFYF